MLLEGKFSQQYSLGKMWTGIGFYIMAFILRSWLIYWNLWIHHLEETHITYLRHSSSIVSTKYFRSLSPEYTQWKDASSLMMPGQWIWIFRGSDSGFSGTHCTWACAFYLALMKLCFPTPRYAVLHNGHHQEHQKLPIHNDPESQESCF